MSIIHHLLPLFIIIQFGVTLIAIVRMVFSPTREY